MGKVLWDMFPKMADAGFRQDVNTALSENRSVRSERFFPDLNAWFEIHVNPSLEGVAFYLKDVTEKLELGRAVKAGAERWKPSAAWLAALPTISIIY